MLRLNVMVEILQEKKIIRKTKSGKKRMRQVGRVEVPQEELF